MSAPSRIVPCVVALLALTSAPAAAQLVRVSPGPLSSSHSKWDDAGDCFTCHDSSGKKLKCLGCHEHKPLARAISAGRGLHAGLKQPCGTCHQEHKGRDHSISDWSKVGGRASFRHQKTGFPLTGGHRKAKCHDCHNKSGGRTRFVGLRSDCQSCHKNPHDFDDSSLAKRCDQCHLPDARVSPRELRARDVPFDHGKRTKVALEGKHHSARCVDCHQGGKMSIPRARRTCRGCHESPHGKQYADYQCADCHSPSRSYKQVRFAHKKTGFRLARRHARIACEKCHKSASPPARPCDSCHDDPHGKRFRRRGCTQCHPNGSWRPNEFNHGARTGFKLVGDHRKARCRDCHRGSRPSRFERFKSGDCRSCHTHKNAHNGQFGDRPCTDCHTSSGKRRGDFDHDQDTRFPLTGLHAPLNNKKKCKLCHSGGDYRNGKTECADCHDSPHPEIADNCSRCHDTKVHFADTRFDHRRSRFKLVGLHRKVACDQCHPGSKGKIAYRTGKTRCADCHADDDPHAGKLGRKCEQCHKVTKGAPKFAHDTMTSFALAGRHAATDCGNCHRTRPSSGPLTMAALAKQPAPKLDLRFPVMGRRCQDCHADHHEGRYGDQCESCHRPDSFATVSGTVHDTGAFVLRGAHDRVPCAKCHQRGRMLQGTGDQCQVCHRDDDRHNNALGPFCGECHRQRDWRPAKFSHLRTGFPLRGAHRTAPCSDCHGSGTYQGTPTDCDACHLRDAQMARDPIHTAEFQPCSRCHREVGFAPARIDHTSFRLSGQHRFVRCRSCHPTGVYAGTPSACEECHITDYYSPRTEPDHAANGYSTACVDCHNPTGWKPARQR